MNRLLSAAVAALALAACHKDAPREEPPPVASSPVPAPPDLLAEVSLRGPDALWGRLQSGVAGPLARFPRAMAGALSATGQLDPVVAAEVDGAQPGYGVVTRTGSATGWAFVLKLRDLRHARATLLEGKTPPFRPRPAEGGLTVLVQDKAASAPSPPTALSPLGYLVVAGSEADLVTLAPYATRTLPSRPVSPHALVVTVSQQALGGPVHDSAAEGWGLVRAAAAALGTSLRKEHGGLGDPAGVIDGLDAMVQGKLKVARDLAGATLTVDAGDTDVSVELTLTPTSAASGTFSRLTTADASPLLTLPLETTAALLLNDDPSSRDETARSLASHAPLVLGPTLDAKGAGLLGDALVGWAAARGSWMTLGLELDGPPALTLRTPVKDGDKASRAIESFLALANGPAMHELLGRGGVKSVSIASASVSGGGSTSIATFQRKDSSKGPDPAVAWAVSGDLLQAAAAESAAHALRSSKDPTRLFGTDVSLAGKLGALRDRAMVVLALRPALGAGESRPSAVLGVGRDKANGWAMLEVDDDLIREAWTRQLSP